MSKEAAYGPKMQALNERQAAFVRALFTKGLPPKVRAGMFSRRAWPATATSRARRAVNTLR